MKAGGRHEEKGGRKGRRSPPSRPKLDGITVTLSGAQVRGVLREVSGTDGSRGLLLAQVDELRAIVAGALANPNISEQRVSQAALKAIGVFCAFAPRGTERGILEVAHELDMNASTTHRYAQAWVEVGLLQQNPKTRKYRMPPERDDGLATR